MDRSIGDLGAAVTVESKWWTVRLTLMHSRMQENDRFYVFTMNVERCLWLCLESVVVVMMKCFSRSFEPRQRGDKNNLKWFLLFCNMQFWFYKVLSPTGGHPPASPREHEIPEPRLACSFFYSVLPPLLCLLLWWLLSCCFEVFCLYFPLSFSS